FTHDESGRVVHRTGRDEAQLEARRVAAQADPSGGRQPLDLAADLFALLDREVLAGRYLAGEQHNPGRTPRRERLRSAGGVPRPLDRLGPRDLEGQEPRDPLPGNPVE